MKKSVSRGNSRFYVQFAGSSLYHICPSNTSLPLDTFGISLFLFLLTVILYKQLNPGYDYNVIHAMGPVYTAHIFEVSPLGRHRKGSGSA
jgi:hypothetical protein